MILNFKLEDTRKTFDLDDQADVKNQSEENLEVVVLQNRFVIKYSYTEQFLKVMDKTI